MRTLLLLLLVSLPIPAAAQPLPAAACASLHASRDAMVGQPADTPEWRAQLGKALNKAAATSSPLGLSRKDGGTNCPSAVGLIACDVLMLPKDASGASTYWDVFISKFSAATVSCSGAAGVITDPSRGWVAPSGGVDPTPDPPPSSDLTARVTALEAVVKSQQTALTALDARVTVLGNRVTALEAHPPAQPCVPTEITTSRDGGGWYGPGHSHRVIACAPPK